MLKNFSARFARGINHCSAPAAPFCLYTLSRSRIYTKCTAACAVAPEWGSCSRAKTAHYGGASAHWKWARRLLGGMKRRFTAIRAPPLALVCRWSWVYWSWTDDGRSVPRGPLALVESECTLQVEPSGGERSSASHNSNTFLLFDRKIFRI